MPRRACSSAKRSPSAAPTRQPGGAAGAMSAFITLQGLVIVGAPGIVFFDRYVCHDRGQGQRRMRQTTRARSSAGCSLLLLFVLAHSLCGCCCVSAWHFPPVLSSRSSAWSALKRGVDSQPRNARPHLPALRSGSLPEPDACLVCHVSCPDRHIVPFPPCRGRHTHRPSA